jgi:hypothetical protein
LLNKRNTPLAAAAEKPAKKKGGADRELPAGAA